MPDITNVKMGVCSVSFNGTDLGHTKGGVEVSYAPKFKDITVDAFGDTVVEKVLIGEMITAKVPLAEMSIENLKVAMPKGTLAGTNGRITLGSKAGKTVSADAAQLVLHPLSESGRDFDVVVYKALVTSEVKLSHKVDEVKVIEVTFEALLDESKSDGNYLALIGDSAAV